MALPTLMTGTYLRGLFWAILCALFSMLEQLIDVVKIAITVKQISLKSQLILSLKRQAQKIKTTFLCTLSDKEFTLLGTRKQML